MFYFSDDITNWKYKPTLLFETLTHLSGINVTREKLFTWDVAGICFLNY